MKRNGMILLLLALLISCDIAAAGTEEFSDTANWVDVHGAGSQRSDPKTGDPLEFSEGHGPQGDAIRILNMVRPVRSFTTSDLPYSIVDTNQTTRFNNYEAVTDSTIFTGQDADYMNLEASYTDNGDGTVSDNITGLMWQQSPGTKMTWDEAYEALESMNLADFDDWRIPTIKELYSLIQFSGRDIAPEATTGSEPFIDTDYFDFSYGDLNAGERIIDSQYMSSTKYVSTTMGGDETVFGVNFADGRIKGYGLQMGNREKDFYVIFVRGNIEYGINNYIDNGDGTISDLATGLMWKQGDLGPMNWENAIITSESLNFAGYDDWRLPDAKELQSIADYSRSPETSNSAAIDPLFNTSTIINEAGEDDYGFYWSSTTHATSSASNEGASAAYVAFGRSPGNMSNLQMPGAGAPPNRMIGPPPRKQ